jgi:Prophage minor tail protein Z (GPZ)
MPEINLDLSDLSRWADHLTEVAEQIPAAGSRAVNRTGDQVATQMGRELASETGMGVRDVRATFIVSRATANEPVYEIVIPSHTTTLAEYSPRQTRQGVSARPWATRRIFPHTFMIRDEVFRRVGKERYPIGFWLSACHYGVNGSTSSRFTVAFIIAARKLVADNALKLMAQPLREHRLGRRADDVVDRPLGRLARQIRTVQRLDSTSARSRAPTV